MISPPILRHRAGGCPYGETMLLARLPPQQSNLSRHRAWGFTHLCLYACCPCRVGSRRIHRRPRKGCISGFNKPKIDLMCPGMAGWEPEVQRLVLALAVTATMLCCASAARAQAVICPLPPWYPRGWELMVRYQCIIYGYGPSYYPPAYYRYPTAYPYQREQVHRRPYLRPGWWW